MILSGFPSHTHISVLLTYLSSTGCQSLKSQHPNTRCGNVPELISSNIGSRADREQLSAKSSRGGGFPRRTNERARERERIGAYRRGNAFAPRRTARDSRHATRRRFAAIYRDSRLGKVNRLEIVVTLTSSSSTDFTSLACIRITLIIMTCSHTSPRRPAAKT